MGWDVAACVEAIGEAVTQFQPGDAAFSAVSHALAEYVVATVSKEEQSGNRFNQLPGW
jgi:NADPH:quinone reductase-like Zn-dependent oxidoreductase